MCSLRFYYHECIRVHGLLLRLLITSKPAMSSCMCSLRFHYTMNALHPGLLLRLLFASKPAMSSCMCSLRFHYTMNAYAARSSATIALCKQACYELLHVLTTLSLYHECIRVHDLLLRLLFASKPAMSSCMCSLRFHYIMNAYTSLVFYYDCFLQTSLQ
jgi:hypothetical protein